MQSTEAPRILVIDDDQAICQSLTMHLKFQGLDADTANRGADGIALLEANEYDLVLCDVGLPDMTGHEVIRQALVRYRSTPHRRPEFIVMTANPTLDNAISALQEGAFQFITKPLSLAFLDVVLQRATELRRLRCQVGDLEAEQENLLLQSVEKVTSELELVAALQTVIQATSHLVKPREAAIWLPVDGTLECLVTEPAIERQSLPGQHLDCAHEALAVGDLVFSVAAETRFTGAPIRVDGKLAGAITLAFASASDMLDEPGRSDLILALATYAGNAIRKDRLLRDLQQSSMQISSLFEVGLAMTSEITLQGLFEVIVDSASRVCHAGRCSLMLVDADGTTLRMRAARGIPEEIVQQATATVGEGIAGSVAASGEPLFIADIEHDDRFRKKNNEEKYRNNSLICVPILVSDRVVGVLNVNNKRGDENFTSNDLNLLTLLASQASVAIDNANRYHDLSTQAVTDQLTGLYRRGYFDEHIERMWHAAETTGRGFALLMCDIDHFKSVNDTHGHQTGDVALRVVADILRNAVREDDLVARYGGEEFAVVLARSNHDGAARVAERIRANVEAAVVRTGDVELKLTISLGGALHDTALAGPAELIEQADQALYEAKRSGRNRVVISEGQTS